MRNQISAVLIFAILLVIIPMFALNISDLAIEETVAPQKLKAPNTQDYIDNPAITSSQAENAPPVETDVKSEPLASKTVEEPQLFTVLDESSGKTLKLSLQDYVRGAVAAEMPPTFHPEAIKAQAVAAHTYALCVQRLREATPEIDRKAFDFTCNVKEWRSYVSEEEFFKRYGDLSQAYWNTICTAVDAVNEYVLLYKNEPIVAAYHSMSSGLTEDGGNVWMGDAPYLAPVESRGDLLAPDFEVVTKISVQEVRKKLDKAFPQVKLGATATEWIVLGKRSQGGYVLEVSIGGEDVHGKELREALGLRSTAMEMTYDGSNFIFTTKGYGHGVGLSQYGADFYARQGMKFWEILAHYYTKTELGVSVPSSDA